MSALQFIASMVRSLSWPAAAVTLALVFRRAVASALSGHLKRLKAGPAGVELEWWEFAASVVREEAERVGHAAMTTGDGVVLDERQQEREQLARSSPGAVMLHSYQEVEEELRALTVKVDPEAAHRFDAHGVAAIARRHGLISDATVKAVEGISVMRNLAAHGGENQLTPERALEYAALTDAVLFAIRQEAGGRHRPAGS